MLDPKRRMSVLKQNQSLFDDYTVLDTVIIGNQRLYDCGKEKDAIYEKEDFTDEDGIRAAELEEEFAELGGWEAESDAGRILQGLGVDVSLHQSLMRDVDPRLKVKVLLAQALFGTVQDYFLTIHFRKIYDAARRDKGDRDERDEKVAHICRVLATYVPDFERSPEWK